MKNRVISLVLTLAMLFSILPAFSLQTDAAQGDLPTAMWIEATGTNGIPTRIDAFRVSDRTETRTEEGSGSGGGCGGGGNSTKYTVNIRSFELYLPGNTDLSQCYLSWSGNMALVADDHSYSSGECPVPAVSEGEKTFVINKTTEVEIKTYKGSANVLPIFIDIDESDGHTIALMDGDESHEASCSGVIYIDGQLFDMPKIKGRGNYTWQMSKDKRAYNITLGTKTTIRGIDSAATKKWSILAEVGDRSLLCNRAGFQLAHAIGVGQDTTSADVWMNGEYQGCYTVTPKYDSFVTKDGYLIEEDNYTETASVADGGDPQFALDGLTGGGTDSSNANLITVKSIGDNLLIKDGIVDESPENMVAVSESIREWLQDAWDAIRSEDGRNENGKYYTDYIDIESFAKMYLMHEYVKSYDVCAGSILFHRDGQGEGDKLIAGPLWDLDNAMGSTQKNNNLGAGADRSSGAGEFFNIITEYKTSIFLTLSRHEDFMYEVYRQYNKHRKEFESLPDEVVQMIDDIQDSAMMNHNKVVDITGYNLHRYSRATTLEPNTVYAQNMLATTNSKTDWPNYAANLKSYVTARSLWFKNTYEDDAYLDPGFCASFDVGSDATITAFDTQDMTAGGHENAVEAYARNKDTGEIDESGEGQVNFIVNATGIIHVSAAPVENFKNIKGPSDTGVPNGYRITKVTGPITITVTVDQCSHVFEDGVCTICGARASRVTFVCDEGVDIIVAKTQAPDSEIIENVTVAFPRDSGSGEIDLTGSGQVNFTVNLARGYLLDDVTAAPGTSYKNLKLPTETGIENGYRITKVSGDLTVTVHAHRIDPSECTHEYEAEVTAPSCTASGFTTYTCPLCGNTYIAQETEALGHDWSEWAFVTVPTCTETGVETRTCARCNEIETQVVEALGHNYAAVITAPTCTTAGFTTHTCGRCGNTYTDTPVAALGHDWGEWTVSTEPSCTEAGEKTRICSVCGATETQAIEPPGHDYQTVVTAPNCTEQGYTTYTCMRCGDWYKADYVDALGHNYVAVVTDPTCTEGGFTRYTCSRCSDSYTADETAALGHSWSEWAETTAPTCTTSGEETRDCSRCDATEIRQVDTLPHMWDNGVITTESSCSDAGVMTYTCTVCGENRTEAIEAVGHTAGDPVRENEVAATCTTDGSYDEVIFCSSCGAEISREMNTVPALNHDYVAQVTIPTCTEGGYTTHTCSRCGNSYTNNETPALDHVLVHHDAQAATCMEIGWDAYVECSRCDYTTYVEIPATGHTPGTGVMENEVAPTCTEKGSYDEVFYCSVCNAELSRESKETAAFGHDYAGVVTNPTCTGQGYTTYTCRRCQHRYADEYVDAIGHKWAAPIWIWAEDNSSVSAKFSCENDSTHTETVEATIAKTLDVVSGEYVFVASVTLDNKSYQEVKRIPATFTISWKDDDGSVIGVTTMNYGVLPTYTAVPTKEPVEGEIGEYTFTGWMPEIVPVTGDATYSAMFSYTGWRTDAQGKHYYQDNQLVIGMFKVGNDYYYANNSGKLIVGRTYWCIEMNGLDFEEGPYIFDNEGRMVIVEAKNGIYEEEGSLFYYVDGSRTNAGLIQIGNDYYYVRTSGEVVHGRSYWITNTNGLQNFTQGAYIFDADGKMIIVETKNGIYEEEGSLFYYVDGNRTYAGLIELDGTAKIYASDGTVSSSAKAGYYYIRSNGEVVHNRSYWITKHNGLLPEKAYQFDTDGRLILEEEQEKKNGIVSEDGSLYYYVDGTRTYAGLIEIDGYYYYAKTNGELVHNRNYWVTKTNGLMNEGAYAFDEQGRMVIG